MGATRSMIFLLFTLLLITTAGAKHHNKETNSIIRQSRMLDSNQEAQFSSNQPKGLYIGICTEEHYEEWYLNEYPIECRERFANATDLGDLFEIYCDPFCGDMYFDYLDNCGNAGIIITVFYRSLCTENEKGVPCFNYLTNDDYNNPKPEVDEYCSHLNETCTSTCYYALDALVLELGCCVNTLYNMSVPDPTTMYQLWDMCDVAKPSYCNNLEFTFAGAMNLASNLNILSIVVVVLLMAAMK